MTAVRPACLLFVTLLLALGPAACGRERRGDDDDDATGDGDADTDADADADADGDGDGDADGDAVPDPGTTEGGEWTDVEPNDDPGHAVPVGILAGPIWAGFMEPFTQLDTAEDTDFFVFRTSDAGTLADVFVGVCGAANTMDLYLTEVVDGRMGPEVTSADGEDAGCVTVVDYGTGPDLLTADTAYVLEVRAQPDAPGGSFPMLYSA